MLLLKPYQENALEDLLQNTEKLLAKTGFRHDLLLQAPTGAGKTIIMAHFLSQACERLPEWNVPQRNLAFIWIAPYKLHIQSFESFKRVFENNRILRPLDWSDITDKRLKTNEVLFLNWESINKKDNVLIQENERGFNLYSVITETRLHGTEVIVVLDEEHLYVQAPKAQEVLRNLNAKIQIGVSATPTTQTDYTTRIMRDEVVQSQMIKKSIVLNPALDSDKQDNQNVDAYLITQALQKRQQLQDTYEAIGKDIRPLLLIQMPNDSREDLNDLEKTYLEKIQYYLAQKGFTTENGRVALWLSKEKVNLEGIERFRSPVDVLIFKQAVALGWDCPRASVLLIFRELRKQSFTIQTVGRVLRMPEQMHYEREELNYGYVYTNVSVQQIEVVRDDADYIIKDVAKRIEDYANLALTSSFANTRLKRNRLGARYSKALREMFEKMWGFHKDLTDENYTLHNRQCMQKLGMETEVKRIEIALPTNVLLTGEVEAQNVANKVRFAKTDDEVGALFYQFCKQNIGGYEKHDSPRMLEGKLQDLMILYAGYTSTEAQRIILYPQNTVYFITLIEKSFERFEEIQQEEALKKQKKVEQYAWDVPETRVYNKHYKEQDVPLHALVPFYEALQASEPERFFARYLATQAKHIHWWYKNGDKGKEHFAIPYTNSQGQEALFYVDFVVKFKSGKIGLFDTKTPNSDSEAHLKHNALLAYCTAENVQNTTRVLVGSLIIPKNVGEHTVFYYTLNAITHTQDTKGWDNFHGAKF